MHLQNTRTSDNRENFFTERVIRRGNGPHREAMESPFLKVLKERLDVALDVLIYQVDMAVFGLRLDSMFSEVFSNLTDTL